MNKLPVIRFVGIVLTIFLFVFISYSVIYWANNPLQEVRENIGGVFFWGGLMLILVFRINFYLMDTIKMIFEPHLFVKGFEGGNNDK